MPDDCRNRELQTHADNVCDDVAKIVRTPEQGHTLSYFSLCSDSQIGILTRYRSNRKTICIIYYQILYNYSIIVYTLNVIVQFLYLRKCEV